MSNLKFDLKTISDSLKAYLEENLNKYNFIQESSRDPIFFFKNGNKIKIKKENRGKFTDYCGGKVTSKCILKGKNSSDPKIRKRATFAENARKWKHAEGGMLELYEITPIEKDKNTNTKSKAEINPERFTRFKNKNFNEFVSVMYPIYKRVLENSNLPLTLILNLIRQDALESGYGLSPKGARGYNLGGIKWNSASHSNYKKSLNPKDNIYYIDFDDLELYAAYKVNLLNKHYNALNAINTVDFINRLHGNNTEKRNYSKNKITYTKNFNGMKSLDRAYNQYINSLKLNNPNV